MNLHLHVVIDTVARCVVRHAARNAPGALADRLQEEWLAHLSENPRGLSRLGFALGCYWAAAVIEHDSVSVSPTVSASAATFNIGGRPMAAAYTHNRRALVLTAPAANAPRTVLCDINTTPLIDVMLVLLVTLIIALPLMTHAVKLDLPGPDPRTFDDRPEPIDLGIDFDGTITWNGVTVRDPRQLESYFRTESRKIPQPEVHLRPDRWAKYDVVARVLASAQRNRMTRLGFVNTAEFTDPR